MSTRKTILSALAKHGQCTYDDLERLTGIARDKARIAINDAKKAEHVSLQKDDVTGQPAYKITPTGKTWLAKIPAPKLLS
jgi:predicted transcriptional regulator